MYCTGRTVIKNVKKFTDRSCGNSGKPLSSYQTLRLLPRQTSCSRGYHGSERPQGPHVFLIFYPFFRPLQVSFGPTIDGAHSPDERVNIASVGKFWKLVLATLEGLAAKQEE